MTRGDAASPGRAIPRPGSAPAAPQSVYPLANPVLRRRLKSNPLQRLTPEAGAAAPGLGCLAIPGHEESARFLDMVIDVTLLTGAGLESFDALRAGGQVGGAAATSSAGAQETTTGRDERTGSEMTAEREERPAPAAATPALVGKRPWCNAGVPLAVEASRR